MEKYSEIVGLPVICIENGKKLGNIKDLIFCPKTKEVKAFLLETKGYRISKMIILMKDILNLGKDAIIVNEAACLKSLKEVEKSDALKGRGEIKGLRIYSRSGEDLGIVKDILFDNHTGIIEGVEISDGLFQDLMQGRNVLPLFGKVEFGDENILVDREAIEEMSHTGGGLKKKLVDGENNKI